MLKFDAPSESAGPCEPVLIPIEVPIARAAPDTPPAASRIESVGLELPERRVTTADLMARCRRAGRVDLASLTGIHARRVCAEGETSLSLAVSAARDCLARSRYEAEDLDIIISCGITHFVDGLDYRFEPAMSHSIKAAIGAPQAQSFDITNACAGMMTGIHILDHMVRSGAVRRGMVVSGEYITSIGENAVRNVRTIASSQLASLTVGDSGAAAIIDGADDDSGGRIHATEFVTLSDHSSLCIGKPCRNAAGAAMYTKAKKLHEVAIANAAPVIRRVLASAGMQLDQIDHVIPHQTSARAIDKGTKSISREVGGGLPKNIVYNLEEFGNTASTTHFVALHRFLDEGRLEEDDRIMLISFASGIVIGALVFTLGDLGQGNALRH
jgi:3-oxoacyl-[acyl-carrier-protein] synthase-3